MGGAGAGDKVAHGGFKQPEAKTKGIPGVTIITAKWLGESYTKVMTHFMHD